MVSLYTWRLKDSSRESLEGVSFENLKMSSGKLELIASKLELPSEFDDEVFTFSEELRANSSRMPDEG